MIKAYNQDYNYKIYWQYKIDKIEALKLCKKISRHFKLKTTINFNNYSRGLAYYYINRIDLPKNKICFGLICHEIGHLLAYKNGYKGHNKKAYKFIHRVYKYGIKFIPSIYLLGYNKQYLLTYKGLIT